MAGLGTTELLIILAVVILLFGARKLPELARSVGESLTEFRKASEEAKTEGETTTTTDEA